MLRYTNQETAFKYTMRAKRGTYKNQGAYTKDIVYFEGTIIVLKHFAKSGFTKRNFKKIMYAKINHRMIE